MAKITLPSVSSGFNMSIVNSNFQAIATELNNKVLYRTNPGGNANQMSNPLDMNSQRILNLPEPVSDLEPLRKIDAGDLISVSQEAIAAAEEAVEARDDAVQSAIDAATSASTATDAVALIGTSVADAEAAALAAQGYAEDAYDNSRLTVGTVSTGAPGSSVIVSIDGVPGTQTISFTIPEGLPGLDGTDGKEVEFQKSATHIQWRYVGDVSWIDLVALVDITGPQGPPGPSGSGTGDVIGPASSVDSHVVVFDGTTGKLIKTSGVLLSSKQDALGYTAENTANKGSASGYAPLDTSSKVPYANLPTIVFNTPEVKTSAFTAVDGGLYLCDTSGGAFTATLPAFTAGFRCLFLDYAGTFQTNALTVARNGANILGQADNYSLNVQWHGREFFAGDATKGWNVK